MKPRLAALVAAIFAAALIAPPEGVVVHRHAGGDRAHLHADLASGALAGHDHHLEQHHQHHHHGDPHPHDHLHRDHHGADDHEHGLALSHAPGGGAHFHTTLLFHQAASPPPPAAAPPRPLARVRQASPPVRIALARPATRSRAPPVRSL